MRIFRVTEPYRSGRLGHLLIEPGDYTEAQLTRHYADLSGDLLRQGRGHWLEAARAGWPDPTQLPTGDIPLNQDEPAVEPDEPLDYEAMTRDELEVYAEQIGFDLTAIAGTGANGNVVKADIVRALQNRD